MQNSSSGSRSCCRDNSRTGTCPHLSLQLVTQPTPSCSDDSHFIASFAHCHSSPTSHSGQSYTSAQGSQLLSHLPLIHWPSVATTATDLNRSQETVPTRVSLLWGMPKPPISRIPYLGEKRHRVLSWVQLSLLIRDRESKEKTGKEELSERKGW